MDAASRYNKNDRKKRLSETRGSPFGFKPALLTKKSASTHNRSSSMNKDKKFRINTDYDRYEYPSAGGPTVPPRFTKKVHLGYQRRDTYDFENGHLGKNNLVQSTKNNPNKNLDLRLLFKNNFVVGPTGQDSRQRQQKTKMNTHGHPFLKIMGKKNKERPTELSPYMKCDSKYSEQLLRQGDRSISRSKPSNSKHRDSLSMKKQEISLGVDKDEIQLQKRRGMSYYHEDREEGQPVKPRRRDSHEQSTVKTIKKQQPDISQLPYQKQQSDTSSFGLTEQEQQTFGERFPYGFEKIKLLGRGGFSLVWLGKHIKSNKQFAIKQIITQNTHQTHIKEIWFGTMFFTLGGVPKPEFAAWQGIKNLVRLYSYEINQTDTWIFYEKCGSSLGSSLYDIRSEKVYGQQKLYKIHYKPIYKAMANNPSILEKLVIEICKPLALLSDCEVVHSDLKTENILIRHDEDFNFTEVKLIDYGSSFEFKNISQFSMATPEYMPPEILNYIIHQNEGVYEQELYQAVMHNYRNPWAVDIWSLGCVLLEIIVGVPLWMSLPLLVPSKMTPGAYLQKEGLFAVKGRLFPEIIIKQRQINGQLDKILEKDNYSRINVSPVMRSVIKAMLEIDFNKRISPTEVIERLQHSE